MCFGEPRLGKKTERIKSQKGDRTSVNKPKRVDKVAIDGIKYGRFVGIKDICMEYIDKSDKVANCATFTRLVRPKTRTSLWWISTE